VRHAFACVFQDSGSLEDTLEGEDAGGVDGRRSDDESHGLISLPQHAQLRRVPGTPLIAQGAL